MSVYVSALCAAGLILAAPVVAAGQSVLSPAATTETIKASIEQPVPDQEKPAGSTFTAGWRDGFFIQNDNGDFRLQFGLLLHADARFSLKDTAETAIDT